MLIRQNKIGQTISGRELHDFLKVGRVFTSWIKERIEKYQFIENEDFQVIWNDTETGAVVEYSGNPNSMVKKGYTKDYLLTLDMAKELSMIENNERGRQARKYFIECEKKFNEIREKIGSVDCKSWLYKKIDKKIKEAIEIEAEMEKLATKLYGCLKDIEILSETKREDIFGTWKYFNKDNSKKDIVKK